jgi:adenosylhomocysteine nucleosidase
MRAGEADPRPTALLGAFGEEIRLLVAELEDKEAVDVSDVRFWTGRLRGRRVVIAMTGVGKVNAAVVTALTYHRFRPSHVIFSGIAGGLDPELHPGDIIIASQTFQHDLGRLTDDGVTLRGARNAVTYMRNPVDFAADPRLLKLAQEAAKHVTLDPIATPDGKRTPKVVTGAIATGDVFVSSPRKRRELHETMKADAVEMEGAAVAQVCHQWAVPCLVIRCISDRADDNAVLDSRLFRVTAAHNAAALVAAIVARLAPFAPDAAPPSKAPAPQHD